MKLLHGLVRDPLILELFVKRIVKVYKSYYHIIGFFYDFLQGSL